MKDGTYEGETRKTRLTSEGGDGGGSTRREFIENIRGASAFAIASSAATSGELKAASADVPPFAGDKGRAQQSFENREKAALDDRLLPIPKQTANRDERQARLSTGETLLGDWHELRRATRRRRYASSTRAPTGADKRPRLSRSWP
jgi:hypothetical protein